MFLSAFVDERQITSPIERDSQEKARFTTYLLHFLFYKKNNFIKQLSYFSKVSLSLLEVCKHAFRVSITTKRKYTSIVLHPRVHERKSTSIGVKGLRMKQ